MEDNDLIIEIDDNREDLEQKSAQMLLAFIQKEFNGRKVVYSEIRKMIAYSGGQEFSDSDISECIAHCILICNDPEMQEWIGFYVHEYESVF